MITGYRNTDCKTPKAETGVAEEQPARDRSMHVLQLGYVMPKKPTGFGAVSPNIYNCEVNYKLVKHI